MNKFKTLYTETDADVAARTMTGKEKTAKRVADAFIDNIEFDLLAQLEQQEQNAIVSFVKGTKESFVRVLEIREDIKILKQGKLEAIALRAELFDEAK